MDDLTERLRGIDRLSPPDLWETARIKAEKGAPNWDRPAGGRWRRPLVAIMASVLITGAIVGVVGIAFRAARPRQPTQPGADVARWTFAPAAGWYVVEAPVEPEPTILVAWTSNVPFDDRDAHPEHPGLTGFPIYTLRGLPEDGIVLTVHQYNPIAASPEPIGDLTKWRVLTLPLQLDDARVREPEAEEPARPITVYQFEAVVMDDLLTVTAYVGSDDPTPATLGSTQEALSRLIKTEGRSVMSPRVTATIPVGSFPRDIAVGAGAVWVSVNDFVEGEPETHSVVRIDPTTNEIVTSIPLSAAGNLAVGDDAVWAIDSAEGPQDVLVRIDPKTNQIEATIPVGTHAFDVAVDTSGVWVTRDIDGTGRSGEVIRIDPSANEIVARIPVEGRIRDVVVGEGGVWVVDSTSTLQREPSLIHIDPVTNDVVATIPGLAELNVTTGEGLVWTQGWLSTIDPSVGTGTGDRPLVLRIDPATNRFVGDLIPMNFFHPFAFWEGGIWFVGEGAAISRLNTVTFEVDQSVVVGPVAQDSTTHAVLDTSTGTIWVANYEEVITRVDLS